MAKRRCKHCDKWSEKFIELPAGTFRNMDHAMIWVRREQARKLKERTAKIKSDKKQARDVNRSKLGWQHKHTQAAFNKMRVLEELLWFKERGLEPVCISCGNPLGADQWCNGHFKTVGAQGCLRYDPINCALQHNVRCNQHLSGDIYGTKSTRGYIKGLLERFGEEEGQARIDYCETNTRTVKWEWRQLEEMRAEFRRSIKRYEQLLENGSNPKTTSSI